jgi:DNA-binding MarR family transcriptional regulator
MGAPGACTTKATASAADSLRMVCGVPPASGTVSPAAAVRRRTLLAETPGVEGELALKDVVDLAWVVPVQHRRAAARRHADLGREQGAAGLGARGEDDDLVGSQAQAFRCGRIDRKHVHQPRQVTCPMSRRIPVTSGRERPVNLGVALREAFVAVNDLVLARLAAHGHAAVRASHSAVFQYLDDAGTTVSLLAERAQMTKQAMAELVAHLETQGYVTRTPDPNDRRAKLVLPTDRGREVIAIAQGLVPELEGRVTGGLSAERLHALREDLETIRRAAREDLGRESCRPRVALGPASGDGARGGAGHPVSPAGQLGLQVER